MSKYKKYKKPVISMDEVKERQAASRIRRAKLKLYHKAKYAALMVKHGLPPIEIISTGGDGWWLHPIGCDKKYSGTINEVYWVSKLVRGGTAEEAMRSHAHEVYRFNK